MKKSIWVAALAFLSCMSAFGQSDLSLTSIFACNDNLLPYQPVLGDSVYHIKAVIHSTANPGTSYILRFVVANLVTDFEITTPGSGDWVVDCSTPCPLDGHIPYSVTVDYTNRVSDPNRSNNTASSFFVPTEPVDAINNFSPRRINGSQSEFVSWGSGTVNQIITWFGKPTTESFQRALTLTGPTGSTVTSTAPFSTPIFHNLFNSPPNAGVTFTDSYQIESYNQRVNATKLRTITWSSYGTLPSNVSPYLQAETTIQKSNAAITNYVTNNLGANFKNSTGPYDAARLLFMSAVRSCNYSFPNSNSDALTVLANSTGDSDGLSRFFVALLRNVGIPARIVEGFGDSTSGIVDGPQYTWAEFYMPGAGWVDADIAASDLLSSSGDYAYYFGLLPGLNHRIATSRASTHTLDGYTIFTLRNGAAFYTGTAGLNTFNQNSAGSEGPDALQPGFLGQTSTRAIGIWRMRNNAITSWVSLGDPGVNMVIKGVGDFDGDGYTDMIGQNSVTGNISVWLMHGDHVTNYTDIGNPGANWNIVGVGDFDRDGKADFMCQNSSTNEIAIWYMSGAQVINWKSVGITSAQVQGVGDFNGDGGIDFLGRTGTSLAVWLLNDNSVIGWRSFGTLPLTTSVTGVGDFDNDGHADILGQINATHSLAIWYTDGTWIRRWKELGSPGSTQSIRCAGMFTR